MVAVTAQLLKKFASPEGQEPSPIALPKSDLKLPQAKPLPKADRLPPQAKPPIVQDGVRFAVLLPKGENEAVRKQYANLCERATKIIFEADSGLKKELGNAQIVLIPIDSIRTHAAGMLARLPQDAPEVSRKKLQITVDGRIKSESVSVISKRTAEEKKEDRNELRYVIYMEKESLNKGFVPAVAVLSYELEHLRIQQKQEVIKISPQQEVDAYNGSIKLQQTVRDNFKKAFQNNSTKPTLAEFDAIIKEYGERRDAWQAVVEAEKKTNDTKQRK